MSVGATPLTFYQGESIKPRFTVSDPSITDITGWTISFKIKQAADDPDPALHSAVGTVIGVAPTLIFDVDTTLPLSLIPGTYVYSIRRDDAGYDWQLAQAAFVVLDSAHKDTP